MKKIPFLILSLFLIAGIKCQAQFGYTPYETVNQLKISTKWGKAKDEDGVRKSALLLAFDNRNDFAVQYSFEVLLYYEGILKESARMEDLCLGALRSNMGRLNGIYFIPQNFTEEQIKNSDFNFELDILEVVPIEECIDDQEEDSE